MTTAVFPRQILPMLAASAEPFDDVGCAFEEKHDGVRCMASVHQGRLRLWGREGVDYSGRYPELAVLLNLPDGTMLDGELVMARNGVADFHALMARHRRRPRRTPFFVEPIQYVVFDLLYLDGLSLLNEPLSDRRKLLAQTLPRSGFLTRPKSVVGRGRDLFAAAIAAGHEGIVAKRLRDPYLPNHRGWRKVKRRDVLPCVVIGYRTSQGAIRDFAMASLIDGTLRFAGLVELGVPRDGDTLEKLRQLHRAKPVVPCPASAQWLEPKLFCTVTFAGWRPGGEWRDAALGSGISRALR